MGGCPSPHVQLTPVPYLTLGPGCHAIRDKLAVLYDSILVTFLLSDHGSTSLYTHVFLLYRSTDLIL